MSSLTSVKSMTRPGCRKKSEEVHRNALRYILNSLLSTVMIMLCLSVSFKGTFEALLYFLFYVFYKIIYSKKIQNGQRTL